MSKESLSPAVHTIRENSSPRPGLLYIVSTNVNADTASSVGLAAVKAQPPDLAVALTSTIHEQKS